MCCLFQNDLMEWLRILNLEQYYDTLARQGYQVIDYVTDITWEDLEEIGIKKLGKQNHHQSIIQYMDLP